MRVASGDTSTPDTDRSLRRSALCTPACARAADAVATTPAATAPRTIENRITHGLNLPRSQGLTGRPRMILVGEINPLPERRMTFAQDLVQQSGPRDCASASCCSLTNAVPALWLVCVISRPNRSASCSTCRVNASSSGVDHEAEGRHQQQEQRQRRDIASDVNPKRRLSGDDRARRPVRHVQRRSEDQRPRTRSPARRGGARNDPFRGPSRTAARDPSIRFMSCPTGRCAWCRTRRRRRR